MFQDFKRRFEDFPQLHEGIQWEEVERSLKADPEAVKKLRALDEKGHAMNVFGERNGETIFRSAQTDVTKIAAEHRTIMYDNQAQTGHPKFRTNGNAEQLAGALGVEVADRELYEKFRVVKGWVWLKTDANTRDTGRAFSGNYGGVYRNYAYDRDDAGSFCAALRVKKA